MTGSTTDPDPGAESAPRVAPGTHVPPDETAARCPYCDRPFRTERLRALHVGSVHAGVRTDAERREYEAARDEEGDELFLFHLKVVGALVVLYTVLLVTYIVVLALQA